MLNMFYISYIILWKQISKLASYQQFNMLYFMEKLKPLNLEKSFIFYLLILLIKLYYHTFSIK